MYINSSTKIEILVNYKYYIVYYKYYANKYKPIFGENLLSNQIKKLILSKTVLSANYNFY